jgi:hypothetical protein
MAEKSANNLLKSIEASKNVPFERVLFALGIRFVGETVAKKLAAHFGSIDNLKFATFDKLVAVDDSTPDCIIDCSKVNYYDQGYGDEYDGEDYDMMYGDDDGEEFDFGRRRRRRRPGRPRTRRVRRGRRGRRTRRVRRGRRGRRAIKGRRYIMVKGRRRKLYRGKNGALFYRTRSGKTYIKGRRRRAAAGRRRRARRTRYTSFFGLF